MIGPTAPMVSSMLEGVHAVNLPMLWFCLIKFFINLVPLRFCKSDRWSAHKPGYVLFKCFADANELPPPCFGFFTQLAVYAYIKRLARANELFDFSPPRNHFHMPDQLAATPKGEERSRL